MSNAETKIKELIEIAKAAQTEFESAVKFSGASFAATNYNGMLIILDDKTQKHLKTFSPAFVVKLLNALLDMNDSLGDCKCWWNQTKDPPEFITCGQCLASKKLKKVFEL